MPIAKNPNGARTDAERRAHNKWEQANRVTLGVRVGKADGEAFRAWCAARGITVNAALSAYVADCLREGADGGAAPAAEIIQAAQPGQAAAEADAFERKQAALSAFKKFKPEQTAPGNSGDLPPEQAGSKTPGD